MDIKTGVASFSMAGEGRGVIDKILPTLSADDLVQERFRAELDGLGQKAEAAEAAGVEERVAGGTLGDAILLGLGQLNSEFQQAWAQKQQVLASDPRDWSVGEMVMFQAQAQTVSTVVDLVSKGVNKVVQGVEQLTKIQ